jgi:hypothetical protein
MSLAKKGQEIRGQYRRRGGCSENAEEFTPLHGSTPQRKELQEGTPR